MSLVFSGLAILIGLSQAKYFLGYDIDRSSKIIPLVKSIIAGADKFSWPPFVLGSIMLAILLVMKHLGKSRNYLRFLRAAGPFTAVVLGTLFVKIFHPPSISLWSDRRRYAIVSDNGAMVGKTDSRHYGDNFLTSSRVVNGSNRQSRTSVPVKFNGRNVSPKYGEKFYSSKNRMNGRCDIHSCSCSPNNEYKIRVEQHSPMTRVSRESKPVSQSEPAKQFYRGSKYNQVDYMHDYNGRPKSKNITSRELFQTKKVWEPTESLKKYHHSNSDSDVILMSTKVQEAQSDLIKSSIVESVDSGENDHENCNSKNLSRTDAGCENDFQVKIEVSCSSKEIASVEPEICLTGDSALNTSDPTQSSTFSSDNCSSCLSEGDNNTTSSNRENQESLTTSDPWNNPKRTSCSDSPVRGD
ncbi:hypothetical protein P8452_38116 [Trifolium repens]|nr:hypothetical protein P8452_38116 [Trifolium repens]